MKKAIILILFSASFGVYGANTDVNYSVQGTQQLHNWISNNIEYPEKAKKDKLEGMVYVQFQIENGAVKESKVLKNAEPELDNAALEIIQKLPKQLLNSSEKATYILPIKFDLI